MAAAYGGHNQQNVLQYVFIFNIILGPIGF